MFNNALWKNPVGWADNWVGRNFSFWVIIFMHIFVAVLLILMPIIIGRCISTSSAYFFNQAILVILFAGFLPVLYLYALKNLLIELKNIKK